MSTTTVEKIESQINGLSAKDRAELLRRLNNPQPKNGEPKKATKNGKRGFVSPNTIWMRENSYKYRGMHVAIKDGKFVASGRTIKEVDLAAKEKGVERPLLAYFPGENEEIWGGW
jgi:hypothetical protein